MDDAKVKVWVASFGTVLVCGALYLIATHIDFSDPRRSKQRRVDVSSLQPGSVMAIDAETLRYYVIRPMQGDVYALAVPMDESKIPMPENYWWQPVIRCKDFGLDTANGVVDDRARFRCRDAEQPSDWSVRWQWDRLGRHVPDAQNTRIDDLYRVRIRRSRNEITFIALETD
jgi:hypothetical protein